MLYVLGDGAAVTVLPGVTAVLVCIKPILASAGNSRGDSFNIDEAAAIELRGVFVCILMMTSPDGVRGDDDFGVRGDNLRVKAAATELRGVRAVVFVCMSASCDQWCKGVSPAARMMAEPREMGEF